MSFPSRQILLLLCVGVAILTAGSVVAAESPVDSSPMSGVNQPSELPNIIIDVENSSNYLSPEQQNVTQESHESISLDVASAVQSDSIRLQGEYRRLELEEKLEADDGETNTEVETARIIEQDVEELEQEKQQLLRSYSGGNVESQTLLREVVRLGVTADQYNTLIDTVRETGSPSQSVSLRYSNLEGESMLLPSPVMWHLESELATGSQTPTYVQAGNESLVLATVVGDTYIREAVMYSERQRGIPQQFGADNRSEADDAFARAEQLYPWTLSDAFQPELRGFGNSSVYRVQASHSHGEMETYLDGGTTNPFYEIHEKNPFSVPVTEFTQKSENGLRLDVQLTDPTGPMRIEVIETGDLEFDNITVSVDDKPVAELSSSDQFYTVQPRGTFEISAETDTGENVSILVFP